MMMSNAKIKFPFGAVALIALLVCAPLVAEELDDAAVISRLSDSDFAKREAMTKQLLADPALPPERIDRLYAHAKSPEARQRLIDVARHQMLWRIARENFSTSEQASLGVSLGAIEAQQMTGLSQPAIYVNRTCPGFPAFVVLEAGDLILSLDGKRPESRVGQVQAREFFIAEIQNHKPGEEVTLQVRRGGNTFEQKVTLARLDALTALYLGTAGAAERQFPEGFPAMEALPSEEQNPLKSKYQQLWVARLKQLTRTQ